MRPARRKLLGVAAGLVAGAGAGACVLAATGVAVARGVEATDEKPSALIEATHTPPLLTLPGEAPTLRYDVYCAPPGLDPESGAPCDACRNGVRPRRRLGSFRALPLGLDAAASQGRYWRVPVDSSAASGLFLLRRPPQQDERGDDRPAGGRPLAPMRSRPLGPPSRSASARHAFGSVRRADGSRCSRVVGRGAGQMGLEPGPELQPIGGSSFDVGRAAPCTFWTRRNTVCSGSCPARRRRGDPRRGARHHRRSRRRRRTADGRARDRR